MCEIWHRRDEAQCKSTACLMCVCVSQHATVSSRCPPVRGSVGSVSHKRGRRAWWVPAHNLTRLNRCSHSAPRSRQPLLYPVPPQRCELCPHKDGALKRTDSGGNPHPQCVLPSRRVPIMCHWSVCQSLRQAGPTWCVRSTSLKYSLPTSSPWSPSSCSTSHMRDTSRYPHTPTRQDKTRD